MPALLTDKFRVRTAINFRDSFSSDNYYAIIGKVTPWFDPLNVAVTDLTPPLPAESIQNVDYQIWRDSFGAKKILVSDNSLVSPRVNWTSGTIYTNYDDTSASLYLSNYFVITDNFDVYKCIEKPLSGAASTVKPTTRSTTVTAYGADGYRWKYMYTLTTTQALKFLNASFFPVTTLLADPVDSGNGSLQWSVQQAAVSGAIESVQMIVGGSGYTSAPTVTISGDGTSATATATVSANSVLNIIITNRGQNYTYATVTIGGPGSGASAKALISPIGGHGSNPSVELNAYRVMTYSSFFGTENSTFSIANDYRQIALIRKPLETTGNAIANQASYRTSTRLTISGLSGTIAIDSIVTQGNNTAIVIEYDSVNSYVYVNNVRGVFNTGSVTIGSATATITSVLLPTIKLFSGDIVHVENRRASNRASDQVEELRATFEF